MEAIENAVYTLMGVSHTLKHPELEAYTVSDEVSCFQVNFYCKCQQFQKCWPKLGSNFFFDVTGVFATDPYGKLGSLSEWLVIKEACALKSFLFPPSQYK